MKTPVRGAVVLAMSLGALLLSACKSDSTASSADPHAQHGAPTASAVSDPHAGHTMPAGSDPHAGHAMGSAGDPHAGHAMPAPSATGQGPYAMRVEPTDPLAAGKPSTLTIRLTDGAGKPVDQLQVVHEKKLHFLIMSRDLTFFAHEHPQRQAEGVQTLPFTFPRPGEYVLFGDYTPEGASQVVSSTRLTVPGTSTMKDPVLKPDDLAHAKHVGAYDVKLDQKVDKGQTTLTFTLTKGGKPVADLQPYLGALGHLVVVDPSASTLLHSHPMGPGDPGKVTFHTSFPSPGLYKMWGEFRPDGQVVRADFVVDASGAAVAPHTH